MQKLLQNRAVFVSVHSKALGAFQVMSDGMLAGGTESNSDEGWGTKQKSGLLAARRDPALLPKTNHSTYYQNVKEKIRVINCCGCRKSRRSEMRRRKPAL
jgi:hypothetical protein